MRIETIGAATLVHGDAVESMKGMPDQSVDLVLTDPPYCSGATREAGRTRPIKTMMRGARDNGAWFGSDAMSTRGYCDLMRRCALEWRRVLSPGGHALVFVDWRMGEHLAEAVDPSAEQWALAAAAGDAIESADLHRCGVIVWDKVVMGCGRHFRSRYELIVHFSLGVGRDPMDRGVPNVLAVQPPSPAKRLHPTEKPLDLLTTLITTLCPPDGVVLDAFAGSHATGVAAIRTDRRFVGVECDGDRHALGCERLAPLSWPTSSSL